MNPAVAGRVRDKPVRSGYGQAPGRGGLPGDLEGECR
jgi:hypothetical protein